MAQQRTDELTWQSGTDDNAPSGASAPDAALAASAEFRELARQRRFLREHEQSAPAMTLSADTSAPARPVLTNPNTAEAMAITAALKHASEQVGEANARSAAAVARAEQAERELAAANERLMAANVLVQDAQRATHQSAERCAWLEGRNDALTEALEVAVHASISTRWRWRRQMAAAKRANKRSGLHDEH